MYYNDDFWVAIIGIVFVFCLLSFLGGAIFENSVNEKRLNYFNEGDERIGVIDPDDHDFTEKILINRKALYSNETFINIVVNADNIRMITGSGR
jgi:hypothetical protein